MSKMEYEWVLGAVLLNTVEMGDTLAKVYWNLDSMLYIALALIPILIFNVVTFIHFYRKKKNFIAINETNENN